MQLTIIQLETRLREHQDHLMVTNHEMRALILGRTEEIQNMMLPLLPTTRREQVILHAENESPAHSVDSTGSESSTEQIIATQHQYAGLRRELEEAMEGDDVERQTDLANMLEQIEIEVEAARNRRRQQAQARWAPNIVLRSVKLAIGHLVSSSIAWFW